MNEIKNAGIKKGQDAYHNQFFDTSSILEETLKKKLASKVGQVKTPQDNVDTQENADDTLKEFGIKTGISEKSIVQISELKESAISLYQDLASNPVFSGKVERLIRRIEDIQYSVGVEPEPFDPLKNRSGLECVEPLDHASKVVSNTLNHYKMFSISLIKAFSSPRGPSIDINLFGESEKMGFEVFGSVIAEEDFDGNEAIDYVYSDEGGLMTVKARINGTWKDVSEKFIINCNVKRYKLGEPPDNIHSVFLGEKIISDGKDKIIKALNINNEDIKFGKCRIFSKNREIVDNIRTLVRVNKL